MTKTGQAISSILIDDTTHDIDAVTVNGKTIPDISTNISTDGDSDTKIVSPKAVKTYVDGLNAKVTKTYNEIFVNPPSFGGLQIASGPLGYKNGAYVIEDDWNHDSYGTAYGKNNGSYYFNFIEMGQFFEKADFSLSDGDITNELDPLDGWRLPTIAEWQSILGTTNVGSTINESTGKHYALIKLTGVSHTGYSTPAGILIFPDNMTITGKTLLGMDNNTQTTGVTADELNTYLSQGCIFLPASGYRDFRLFYGSSQGGNYWSSTERNGDEAYYIHFSDSSIYQYNFGEYKDVLYWSVRLVKSVSSSLISRVESLEATLDGIEELLAAI